MLLHISTFLAHSYREENTVKSVGNLNEIIIIRSVKVRCREITNRLICVSVCHLLIRERKTNLNQINTDLIFPRRDHLQIFTCYNIS